MKDVKVKAKELLGKLKTNRTGHKKEYDDAMVGYRAELIKVCESWLALAREHKDIDSWRKPTQPKEYLREYDRAIAMCEATVDSEIVLSANDFGRYWMDDWEWTESFKTGTSSYNSRN